MDVLLTNRKGDSILMNREVYELKGIKKILDESGYKEMSSVKSGKEFKEAIKERKEKHLEALKNLIKSMIEMSNNLRDSEEYGNIALDYKIGCDLEDAEEKLKKYL